MKAFCFVRYKPLLMSNNVHVSSLEWVSVWSLNIHSFISQTHAQDGETAPQRYKTDSVLYTWKSYLEANRRTASQYLITNRAQCNEGADQGLVKVNNRGATLNQGRVEGFPEEMRVQGRPEDPPR